MEVENTSVFLYFLYFKIVYSQGNLNFNLTDNQYFNFC